MKYLAALIAAISIAVFAYSPASADVGEVEFCVPYTGDPVYSTSTQNLTNTVEGAFTFEPDTSFTVTGMKVPIYRNGADITVTVEVWATTSTGGYLKPDVGGGNYATGTLNSADLVEAAADVSQKTVICDKTTHPEQILEFGTPFSVSAGTRYAVVAWGESGGGAVWHNANEDFYADGEFFDNGSVSNRNVAADWNASSGGGEDSGLVVYGNIFEPTQGQTVIDTRIEQALDSFGLNTPLGRILAGTLIVIMVMLVLMAFKVPFIFALAIAGMFGGAATLVQLTADGVIFDTWIFLSAYAVVGFAIMIMIYRLVTGGSSNE